MRTAQQQPSRIPQAHPTVVLIPNRTFNAGVPELVTELCVLRTFGGVDFSLIFTCAQSVPEFLWDGLRASIEFPVMPK
eukprot:COSAG02_NODE_16940_length_1041_cov_2.886412_1_plen_77_part_01